MKSTSNSKKTAAKKSSAPRERVATTRIDAPHPIAGESPPVTTGPAPIPEVESPIVESSRVRLPSDDAPREPQHHPRDFSASSPFYDPLDDASERDLDELRSVLTDVPDSLRLQASQLASLLRVKQQEIDQREATLHTQMSQLDKERRAFRLQVREYHETRIERETEHAERLQEIEKRLADLSAMELALNADARFEAFHATGNSNNNTEPLDQSEPLNSTKPILNTGSVPVSPRASFNSSFPATPSCIPDTAKIEEAWQELESQRRTVRERIQQLNTLESMLQDNWNDCERKRRDLEIQHAGRLAALEEQQQRNQEAQRQFEANSKLAESDLHRREESLAKRAAAIEQVRLEAAQIHHDSLEMRIVLEQLWQQLADRLDAAELARSIAASRAQLADEYQLASQTLLEQRREAEELSRRLHEQQAKLRRQRSEMQEWLARRQHEIHDRETRLSAREQQLAKHDQTVVDLRRQLEQERLAARNRLLDLAHRFAIKVRMEEGLGT